MMETASSTPLEKVNTRQTSGWAPLVYPASALSATDNDSKTNPWFPLEENVLRAAIREMLILDDCVNSETLVLSLENVKFRGGMVGKRSVTSSGGPKKKTKMNNRKGKKEPSKNEIDEETEASDDSCKHTEEKLPNAEALVDVIVQRSHDHAADATPFKTAETLRNPRKVSDADCDFATSTSRHMNDAIKRLDATYDSSEISLVYNIRNRSMIVEETPVFLEVSIASESVLRELARDVTRRLVESFDEKTIRLFLGYKSSSLKRDRLLAVLAEHLFDVSHAMFAWKQTEEEIQSQLLATSDLDQRIVSILFDSRALRKIGGFDDSSLLPHALSIYRLSKKGVSWEDFAKTENGRALLKHHVDGKAVLAGQKRRGLRVRRRNVVPSSDSSEAGQRSRSSSIASYDTMEHKRDGTHYTLAEQSQVELWSERRNASLQMPDVLLVSLRKPASESWGVLLSKEGDMCIVVRSPEPASSEDAVQNGRLKIGDVILSVGTEAQESAEKEEQDWFRFVVNKFKTSNELDLIVRRVGCGRTTLASDESSNGWSVCLFADRRGLGSPLS